MLRWELDSLLIDILLLIEVSWIRSMRCQHIEMWSWSLVMRDDLLCEGFIFLISRLCMFPPAHEPSILGLFWNDFHLIFSLFKSISFLFILSDRADCFEEGSCAQIALLLVLTFSYSLIWYSYQNSTSSGKTQLVKFSKYFACKLFGCVEK